MLFCQLSQAHSLREICGGLAICSKDGGFMNIQYIKEMLMEMPQRGIADFADVPKELLN